MQIKLNEVIPTCYVLERKLPSDNRWYKWGTYSEIAALVQAAAELGSYGYVGNNIRIVEVQRDD